MRARSCTEKKVNDRMPKGLDAVRESTVDCTHRDNLPGHRDSVERIQKERKKRMAKSQDTSVQNEVEAEVLAALDAAVDAENNSEVIDEKSAEGKRGRNPLTHADVMKRIQSPNPVDVSFAEFAESKFGALTLSADVESAFILGSVLGRWSTVVKWWNESDEQKSAKEKVLAWQAEQEMSAKVAKLTPTEKAEFDAAPESVKAMILRFISL